MSVQHSGSMTASDQRGNAKQNVSEAHKKRLTMAAWTDASASCNAKRHDKHKHMRPGISRDWGRHSSRGSSKNVSTPQTYPPKNGIGVPVLPRRLGEHFQPAADKQARRVPQQNGKAWGCSRPQREHRGHKNSGGSHDQATTGDIKRRQK